jgi:hypothetical protein
MEGIQRAVAISAMNLALEGVVGIGCLAEREGDYQLAARLVGLAEPLANIDVNARITLLLARLKSKMDAEQLQAARQEGRGWELEAVIRAL